MGLIRIIDKGMPLFGYVCPTCGRKELHDKEPEGSLICENCADTMQCTTIPKIRDKEPQSDGGG